MGYSWDNEVTGTVKENSGGYHDLYFLRALVKNPLKYSLAPKPDDYLSRSQSGSLDGLAESMHRLNSSNSASNAANISYARSGTYDIASKVGLYNPLTSVSVNSYAPKRNPYQTEDQY